jgi:hypothetical protein
MAVSTVTSNFNYGGARARVAGGSALGNAFRGQMPPFMPAQFSGPFSTPGGASSPGGFQAGPPPEQPASGPLGQALGGPPEWMQRYDREATPQRRQQDQTSWLDTVRALGPKPSPGSPAYAGWLARYQQAAQSQHQKLGAPAGVRVFA